MKLWSFWTLNDALSFLKVFGTVAWTPGVSSCQGSGLIDKLTLGLELNMR